MENVDNLETLRVALNYYRQNLRREDFPSLELSELYDLFPERGSSQAKKKWPVAYPFANNAGVYFIFDEGLRLLYIGKASMNNHLVSRLSAYFEYDDDKKCRVKSVDWIGNPRYISVVPMDEQHKFEAPALEEYLIGQLVTTDNKAGT